MLAQALGAALLRGALDGAPAWALKGLLTLATCSSPACACSAARATAGFAYLFLWATPYAFFFGLRHAVAAGPCSPPWRSSARTPLLDGDPLSLAHVPTTG